MEERTYRGGRPLFWILGLAFFLRIVTIPLTHFDGSCSDEREYFFLANQVLEGKGFVDTNGEYSIKAPLFPLLVALCLKIWPSSLVLPFLLVALTSSLSAYVGYLLTLRFWQDRRTALCAGGLIGFLPPLILYGALLMTESLFILFLLLTMLIAELLRREDRVLLHVLFGVAGGLAVLTRAAALGFVPLLLVVIGIDRRRAGIRPWRLLIALSVWCLVLLPWTLRNYRVHTDFIPVSTFGGRGLLIGNNPFAQGTLKIDAGFYGWLDSQLKSRGFRQGETTTEARQIRFEQAIALEYMASHPVRTLELAVRKAYTFWIYPVVHRADVRPLQAILACFDILLLLSAVCGVTMASLKRVRFPLVWLAIAYFTGLQMILYAEARFRLPLLPLLCVVGAGASYFWNRDLRRSVFMDPRPRLVFLSGVIVVALLYALTAALFFSGTIS